MAPDKDDLAFQGNPRNIQYTAKVARLSNQTESGVARAIAEESENFLERQYGRLSVVLDVSFTDDTYDISEVISETMHREFYSDLNRTVIDSFEHALTAVNQTLADLASEGQNDWVGKLNAVIGVLHENEIHLSQVGSAQAYLVRGHSATHITEGLAQHTGSGATAKTFVNVASGNLEVGDKVLISTAELFYHLSIMDIRRHLYLHPPAKAIRKIADQILTKGMPDRLAVAVLELTTIDLISSETVSDDPDEIILGAPRRHFEALQKFKPFRPDTPLAAAAENTKKFYDKKVKPALTGSVKSARKTVRNIRGGDDANAPRRAAGTPETQRTAKSASPPVTERAAKFTHTTFGTLKKVGEQTGHHVRKHSRPVISGVGSLWRRSGIPESSVWKKTREVLRPVTSRLAALPIRKFFRGQDRALYRNLLIGAVVVLIASLAFSVRAANAKKDEDRVRERIKVAEDLRNKAETSHIVKDAEGARRQLDESHAQAAELAKQKRLKGEVAALQSSILASYDRINNAVPVPDTPLGDFATVAGTTPPTKLALAGVTLFASADTGPLYSLSQADKVPKVAILTTGIPGTIRSMATTSNGIVLFLTDKPSVWQLDTGTNAITETPIATGGTWEAGSLIDTVQQNIFITEPGANQIWRHGKTLSSYEKGQPYARGEVDLKATVDVVTGNQVYVLKSDATVNRFSGGELQAYAINPPPAPQTEVKNPTNIAVNSLSDALYVADPGSKRIIEYNAQGQYSRQFKLDAFGEIKDMVLDEKSNTMFVLSGSKIFQFSLAASSA